MKTIRSTKKHRQRVLVGVSILGLLLALAGPGALSARPRADFDRDGHADLAIGVPGEDAWAVMDAGAVNVLYGTSDGLDATGDQLWDQDVTNTADHAENYDEFGDALAAGDFNGDGYFDLAVGVPGEDVGTSNAAGAVHVFYGSAAGLTAGSDQLWHQGVSGVADLLESLDSFGSALAAGDFDDDGYTDLAVGVPFESVGTTDSAGAVNVLYGSVYGLNAADDQLWHQDVLGVADQTEVGDMFGWALAAGDLNGDGYADLAVGVSGEDDGSIANTGAVNVLYGSAAGLSASGNQFWHQGILDIQSIAEEYDDFGEALAIGDFDGDGYGDLAVGVPGEGIWYTHEGAVNVLYGSAAGLTTTGNQLWHQGVSGVGGVSANYENFGAALATADFNRDGYFDLAVGVPYDDVGATVDAGGVNVLYGSVAGLATTGSQWLHQNKLSGLFDTAETDDRFGWSLATGDWDGDGYFDLAVGVPYEDIGGYTNAGEVNVWYGWAAGLGDFLPGDQMWYQNSTDVEGWARDNDWFGHALASIPPRKHKIYLPLVLRQVS